MKKSIVVLVLFFSQYSIADICATGNNVKDYFLSIPSEKLTIFDDLKGPLTTKGEREAVIETLDIRNGFISLKNETVLSKIEIALYRTQERRPVMLITSDGASVQNVYAFSCYRNVWHDVTGLIFPKQSYDSISDLYKSKNVLVRGQLPNTEELSMVAHTLVRYELPRKGKSIKAYASHPDIDSHKKLTLYYFKPPIENLTWQ